MSFAPLQVLVAILIFQCTSFAVFLFSTGRGKKKSNVLLGSFLLILATHMIFNLLSSFYESYWFQFVNILGFAYGPLLWFYIGHLIYKEFKPWGSKFVHFTPLMVALIVFIAGVKLNELVLSFTTLIQLMIYVFVTLQNLLRYQRTIPNTRSNVIDISLKWIYQLIIFVVVIATLDFSGRVFLGTTKVHSDGNTLTELREQGLSLFYDGDIMFAVLVFALFLFVNLLVFKGLNRPDQFLGITSTEIKISKQITDKHKNSSLKEEEINSLAEIVNSKLSHEKLYLDSNLNLESFSRRLELPPRIISQVINQNFRTNFSDYINGFRLKHAEELLVNNSSIEMNISEIVYESGFNSRSSFYSYFKQIHKVSPKEYREQYTR